MRAALLATVPNPYSHARVDDAWERLPADVGEIHRATFDGCVRLVGDVAGGRQSHGAVLAGQPGAGKTHALARLRRHVVEGERGWFVYVRPITGPDRFFRHVLRALAGDILRPPHGVVAVSQLEVALARHLMAETNAPAQRVAGWWETVRAHHREPESVERFLRAALDPIAEATGLDLHVARVVGQLAARLHRPEARAWLLGRAVTEEDCRLLGVPGSLDDEAAAEEAAVTLLAIGGEGFPVVLAFDQIEGLQRTRDDTESLMAFAHGVDRLFSRVRNVAALTCVQVAFLNDLAEAVGIALYRGRLAERVIPSVGPLSAREVVDLARQRASASTDLQAVRLFLLGGGATAEPGLTDPLWPLSTADLEVLATQAPTPREVLFACRDLFEQQRAAPEAGVTPAPPPPPASDPLEGVWNAALDRERDTPVDVIDEGVYVDGLLRAIDATSPTLRAERSRVKDVDLEVSSPGATVGVSVCNAEHMTSLAGRLRRLVGEAGRGRFDRLCLVRDARLPIKATAVATNRYLAELREAGAILARPPVEAYVALAAIRNLLAEAAAGDLTVDGRTVEPAQLKDWLAQHPPDAVVDLVSEVAGAPSAPSPDGGLERAREALARLKVADLGSLAEETGLSPDAIRGLAAETGSGLALIDGTPPVVFLHPDAVERA